LKPGFLYLLLALPRFAVKIGVTKYPKRRVKDINKSLPRQIVLPVFVVWVFNYEDREERLHGLFGKERFTFRGSGKTEYFTLNVFQFIGVIGLMLLFQLETITRILVFAAVIVAVVLMLT
jgi:hypothetical protein